MKQVNLLLMSAAMTLAACGGTKDAGQAGVPLIERSDIQIEGKRMTPEALWAMGRIGGVAVSPDEKQIAYTVAYYSVPENKSNREVFVMNTDGTGNKQITHTPWQENEVNWIKGGTKLAFLSNEGGSSQLWEMNPDGSGRKQLTQYDGDIEGYSFSPDGKKLLFIAQVKTKQSTADKYPDLPKATGIIVTDLMYKHWDEWVTGAPHPFVADFDGNGISNIKDILEGEPYESPMRPWGGIEQLAWSPAGDKVAYTCRKKTGLAYAISTNSDIYIYDLATKKTDNITEENKGYDTNPQYSPDGKYIAWQSMERDGYEADLNRLFIMNLETGEKRFVSKEFESNVDGFLWNRDSKSIYFIGVWHGETQIYNIDLAANDKVTQLTDGMYDYASLALAGDKVIALRHSMSMGDEIYAVSATRNGDAFAEAKQLTFENKQIYDQLEMGKVEARWMKTTDGKQMLTWVIYPPQFDPNKKYPIISSVYPGPFFEYVNTSFRVDDSYNMRLAQLGFIVVSMGHRGGSPMRGKFYHRYGYGKLRDYPLADDKYAIEQLADRYAYIDLSKVGIFGHSGGGFMSTAALCTYPDFYTAAVSSAGNHDNNIFNRGWSEIYHGVKEAVKTVKGKDGQDSTVYTYSCKVPTNMELAKRLKGHLLLVTGDMDKNVHPANTLRMVDALIKAKKNFEMIVLPGNGHGFGGKADAFFERKLWYHFAKYLLGDESTMEDVELQIEN